MTAFALVRLSDDAILERRDFADAPPDLFRKGIAWRPVVVTDPAFDPASQVKSAPVTTVERDRVTVVAAVRAMTTEELEAAKTSTIDALDALALKVLLNHENRLRALEGKQAATTVQFKAALRALL